MKNIFYIVVTLLVTTTSVNAEKALMRLFYSPAERALIDINRSIIKKTKPAAQGVTPVDQTQRIEVKGFLKRHGKPDVVWVNSKNTLKSNKPLSDVKVLKLQDNGKVKIKIKDKGIVRLKPGQFAVRSQQSIREAYENSKK